MRGRSVGSAMALLGMVWAGAVAAGTPGWYVCRAEAVPTDGVVYVLQSDAFAVEPYDSLQERMFMQRPFEAPLQALGARGLNDATVRCTAAAIKREEAQASGKTLRDKALAASAAAKAKVVEKPWRVELAPTAGFSPVLLVGRGELASAATRASSPEKWGLTATDYAVMHNQALLKKAGLPGRRRVLETAAAAGDAYAQHLLAVRPPGQPDDMVMMKKAADQGLLRAMADYHSQTAMEAGGWAAAEPHVIALAKVARRGSAHADFVVGATLLSIKDVPAGNRFTAVSLLMGAEAKGYAPAQLWVAQDIYPSGSDYQRRQAIEAAKRAAAQGLAEAEVFLAAHPTP